MFLSAIETQVYNSWKQELHLECLFNPSASQTASFYLPSLLSSYLEHASNVFPSFPQKSKTNSVLIQLFHFHYHKQTLMLHLAEATELPQPIWDTICGSTPKPVRGPQGWAKVTHCMGNNWTRMQHLNNHDISPLRPFPFQTSLAWFSKCWNKHSTDFLVSKFQVSSESCSKEKPKLSTLFVNALKQVYYS